MRKVGYILSVLLVSLLLVGGMVLCLLGSEKVERAVVGLVSDEISKGLGTEAKVGNISYAFPLRLAIDSIYLADEKGDSLLFVERIEARMSILGLLKKEVKLSDIALRHAKVDIHRLDNEQWNFGFITSLFPKRGGGIKGYIAAREVEIEDVVVKKESDCYSLHKATLDLYYLTKDSVDAQIHSLSASIEKEGKAEKMVVEDASLRVGWEDSIVQLQHLRLKLPHTELRLYGWVGKGEAGLQIEESHIGLKDFAFFAPILGNIDKTIDLHASIGGSKDSVWIGGIGLKYDKKQVLAGNASYIRKEGTWTKGEVQIACDELTTNAGQIQDIISDIKNKPFTLPKEIARLGKIVYKGKIEGDIHRLHLDGTLRTALGSVRTKGRMEADSLFEHIGYDAKVIAQRFELGRLLANETMGPISVDIASVGQIHDKIIGGEVEGKIKHLTYKGYAYQDISIDGAFRPKHFDGKIRIDDENLNVDFAGHCTMANDAPDVNFDLRLRRFCPEILGIGAYFDDSEISASIAANISGRSIEQVNGYVVIDSLRLRRKADATLIEQIKLTVSANEQWEKNIHLTSDVLTARVAGRFGYKTIKNDLLRMLYTYAPNAFPQGYDARIAKPSHMPNTTIDAYVYGHAMQELQQVLGLKTTISDLPVIKAYLNEENKKFGLSAYASKVEVKGKKIEDITLDINNAGGPASLALAAKAMHMEAKAHITAWDNAINIATDIAQKDSLPHRYGGKIHMHTHIDQYAGLPLVDVHIMPSSVVIKDSTYHIAESHAYYSVADTMVRVEGLNIESETQHIRINGIGSRHEQDTLNIELRQVDIGYILPFVLDEKAFKAGGQATGWARLYRVLNKPLFEADVRLDHTHLNESEVGYTYASVALDPETKHILIGGDVYNPNDRKIAHVDGQVIPGTKAWGITVYPDSLPIAFINHWSDGILSDVSGYGSGKVDIFGGNKKVWVTAKVKVDDGALTIPFTGCRYYLSDSVTMDSTSIQFTNITARDEEGHKVYINGALEHTNFKDFRFHFDAKVEDALALNLPEKAGEMLQGRVYGNGHVNISGNTEEVNILAKARTVGKSKFRFSIDYASEASETKFIEFTDHTIVRPIVSEKEEAQQPKQRQSDTRVFLGMDIDVDQHLLAQLMLGERNGDMIQGRGDGALRFTYDSHKDEIRLMGNYELRQGILDFTVGNAIRRQFTLAEGGNVAWTGDVAQPQVDVTAKYRVTASLKDLFGSDIDQIATTRTSVPVNTCLHMQGALFNPTMQFAIELPNSDESVQSQVRAIINTDEMLMRQVVYLLVFGKFFTPEYMTNTQYVGVNETYSLLSSTITGQINTWLSKLTNVFTMGVNIRADGQGADASQEYEAQFQLQPIDRLVINGNVGYRYNDIANQPFFGDLDIEALLTEDGKLRLKGYTHTVDKYSLRQANTIQGIGLVWKQEFNSLSKEERAQRRAEREAKCEAKKAEKEAKKKAEKTTNLPVVADSEALHSADSISAISMDNVSTNATDSLSTIAVDSISAIVKDSIPTLTLDSIVR